MTGPELTEQDLARAVAAEAPRPRPAFEAQLRQRVDDGFPRERRSPRLKLPRRKVLLPAMAGVASVLVAATVMLSGGEDGTVSTLSDSPGDAAAPAQQAMRAAPESGDFRPGTGRRRIERSADLSLAVPGNRLQRTGDRIASVTDRRRGFVLSSSTASGRGATEGRYDLRVPATELRAALRDLSALGTVRSLDQRGQDVTSAYESSADRLQTARSERTGLLRRLERAGTDTAAGAIRRQLALNATEIASLREQLRGQRTRTDYAAITVTVGKAADRDGAATGPRTGIDDAFHDALGSLTGAAELSIRVLGVATPIGLLALMAGLAARTVRRRRREAILS